MHFMQEQFGQEGRQLGIMQQQFRLHSDLLKHLLLQQEKQQQLLGILQFEHMLLQESEIVHLEQRGI